MAEAPNEAMAGPLANAYQFGQFVGLTQDSVSNAFQTLQNSPDARKAWNYFWTLSQEEDSTEDRSGVVILPTFEVTAQRLTIVDGLFNTTLQQDLIDLSNRLGRRPTLDEIWRRDLIGGSLGSMKEMIDNMTRRKTSEEIIQDIIRRDMESIER